MRISRRVNSPKAGRNSKSGSNGSLWDRSRMNIASFRAGYAIGETGHDEGARTDADIDIALR